MVVFYGGKWVKSVEVNPHSTYFRLGTSVFETILFNGRAICHLERHLKRLEGSLKLLGFNLPNLDYEGIISKLIESNGLEGKELRVNIHMLLDYDEEKVTPMVMVKPYERPKKAIKIIIPRLRATSDLFRIKSGSYLLNMHLKKEAEKKGAYEALIVGRDGTIHEASTSSLIFKLGDTLLTTDKESRLPSISLEVIGESIPLKARRVTLDDLSGFTSVFVVNSLLGALPVISVGNTRYRPDWELSRRMTELVILKSPED